MPYITRDLLTDALRALKSENYSPLVTVSLPCMLSKDLPTCVNAADAARKAINFGAKEEREWLDQYFRPGGGPSGRPYYMPGSEEWVQDRYADRSLQRRRKDFDGSVFYHPDEARWALRKTAARVLRERVLHGSPPLPLAALMIWMWRERKFTSLQDALKHFITEIKFDRDGFLGSVYSDTVPSGWAETPLSDSPLEEETMAEIIGGSLPAPAIPAYDELIARIEKSLTKRHTVLIPGLVERIIGGWLVGDIAVLVGPSGSGKTFLTNGLAEALEDLVGPDRFTSVFVEINRDYDQAQFIGYENLAGEYTSGRFVREALLGGQPTDPRLVILDEWNLSQIDAYFAPILSVIETGKPIRLPGRVRLESLGDSGDLKRAQPDISTGNCILPQDTLFIATCNSWLAEPETRLPISGPVKRRCRIIDMPNLLAIALKQNGTDGLIEICNELLRRERETVTNRRDQLRPSMLDTHRSERLASVTEFTAIPEQTRTKLLQVCRVLLENDDTRATFTVGVLRDILLSTVYARAGSEFAALGEQIASKVLHQLYGNKRVLESIRQISRDLPNVDEILSLTKRMEGAGENIRPLV